LLRDASSAVDSYFVESCPFCVESADNTLMAGNYQMKVLFKTVASQAKGETRLGHQPIYL
jgi:hypothetical protein